MATKINMQDVMTVIDGNECHLKMKLSREGRETVQQYYSLRYKYCMAKFEEIYGGKPPVPFPIIPRSIIDFWNKCDATIKKTVQEMGIEIAATGVEVRSSHLGSFTIDAIGKTRDKGTAIFKIIFGASWRSKYAVQIVKELDYAFDAGMFEGDKDEIALIALIVGMDDAETSKATREIRKNAEHAKNGNVKIPSWDMMREEFNIALQKTTELVDGMNSKNYDEVETNPVPTNCGFCPFHNTDIVAGKTCVGYYADASTTTP